MPKAPRIGILTGGGDVPGLNSVIKSVVYETAEMGYEVAGILRGWKGLTHMHPATGPAVDPEFVRMLNRDNTRTIDRTGGTVLHTSRVNPPKMKRSAAPAHIAAEKLKSMEVAEGVYDFTPIVLENIASLGLEYLIVIGGDDTLSFSGTLDAKGVNVIGVPKTMDNDVQGTEYCIGFSTAVTRAQEIITRQRTTLGSHERIGVFRVFGRDAGFTAIYAAYVTAGRCVIPEVEFELEALIDILAEDKRDNSSHYSFVIASEGALWKGHALSEYGEPDAYGHRKKSDIGLALSVEIQKRLKEETMVADLTYELRSGEPDSLDQIVSTTMGNVAVDLIREKVHGRLVAIQDGKYATAPLPDPKLGPRNVNVDELYNLKRFRPRYSGRLGSPMMLVHLPTSAK